MTKLKDTERAVEDLKAQAEALYVTPESDQVAAYPKFERFEAGLNALLSTVAKYRLQLRSSGEALVFGPKTLKAVEALVFNYDKLYEVYEELLLPAFAQVRPLYEAGAGASPGPGPEPELPSISEETRSHLRLIDEWRRRRREAAGAAAVDFGAIRKSE